jgi:aldehyde:ferredoxin oxidoreductase
MGKVLHVDLSAGKIETEPLDETYARLFLGGRGLGARMLWDLVGPEVDPLAPENVLVFCTGPLTATGYQTSNRFSVSTKSPLTGTVLDANSGGFWGVQLKRAGYDAVVVGGRAERPVWLEVTSEGAALHDAAGLWGKRVFETTETLGQRKNRRSVLCIGPAGENLCRIAAIVNDRERALARGGPGAVMGSKNLKAVVAEGSGKPAVADEERLKFVRYESRKMLTASPITSQALPEFGTAVMLNVVNYFGALPTRNFRQSQFEGADRISGEALAEGYLVGKAACWSCPIACTRISKADGVEGEGPEYETAWAFGAQCGVDDLAAIIAANRACNDLGLDTISTGSTIACAMELGELGHVESDLRFGRADLLAPMVEDIAYRRGLGDELAEGSRRFAEMHGAPELSMSVKGLELPAYDPRGMQGQGLLFATSNRGACHMRGNMLGLEILGLPKLIDRFQVQGKSSYVILHQDTAAAVDSLVVCKFANIAVGEEYFARALGAVTGLDYSTGDLVRAGERIWTLERLYNLREGFTAADDTLPPRLLEEPVAEGPSEGWVVKLAPMLAEYYRARGWDEQGVPGRAKLEELDLMDCVSPCPRCLCGKRSGRWTQRQEIA